MTHRSLRAILATAVTAAAAVIFAIPAAPSAQAATATNNPDFTANVMAPLEVSDWNTFDSELATVHSYGVDAVSVDVWWGKVEGAADQSFDWSYYDTIFSKIKAKGLKIVPIFSFHQCGGNVGDSCNIPLPSWLWGEYTGRTLDGVTLDGNGLKYKSEQGNFSSETVQGWADALVDEQYAQFATAFKNHFGSTYASSLQEINVSLGPAGELRYPSYNSQDTNTGYPTRGALQSYSPLAVASLRAAMIAKYGNLAAINAAWGTNLTSTSQINPPSDANNFFTSGAYRNSQYGKDFIDWYNGSLVNHGKSVLTTVIGALGSSFPGAAIGYKIPGVHWAMDNPAYPRAAEVAAGLIQTSVDLNSDATGHGYNKIVGLANQLNTSRKVILHFTCLEMSNDDTYPAYSLAQALVFWVAHSAAAQGVTIKGENALASGVTSNAGWDNIVNAFDWASYVGLTVLRIGQVSSGTGQTRYTQFIQRYRTSGSTVTVHYAEFESASSYSIHPWSGLDGDRQMSYEGYINGRHWWKVTISGAPSSFMFCFVNSNGNWDGTNRQYSGQASDIYVLPYNSTVYTSRP